MKAEFVREIEPGEIVIIKGNKLESAFCPTRKKKKELIVFLRIFILLARTAIFLMTMFIR
jgi:glutamine phosphoribosylpyrophosphate amidotransferase